MGGSTTGAVDDGEPIGAGEKLLVGTAEETPVGCLCAGRFVVSWIILSVILEAIYISLNLSRVTDALACGAVVGLDVRAAVDTTASLKE